jgi:tetratricopeptide (TPR) repeat protein
VIIQRIIDEAVDFDLSTAFFLLGKHYINQADHDHAGKAMKASIQAARAHRNQSILGSALNVFGWIKTAQGKYRTAKSALDQALRVFERIGEKVGVGYVLSNLNELYRYQENYREGLMYIERSLDLQVQLGNQVGIAVALGDRGILLTLLGEYAAAAESLQHSLELSKAVDYKYGIIFAQTEIAYLRIIDRQFAAAAAMLGQALNACVLMQRKLQRLTICVYVVLLAVRMEGAGPDVLAFATTLASCIDASIARLAITLPNQAIHQSAINEVRDRLDKSRFAAAWAAGQAMDFEQVVAAALDWLAGPALA